jgi:ArsR family transcriptional regulator
MSKFEALLDNEDSLEVEVELFRALGDPTRLEMVRRMAREGEVACSAFLEQFDVTKSTISYHVRILRTARLVHIRKEGPWYFYRLAPTTFDAVLPGLLDLVVEEHDGRSKQVSPPRESEFERTA